jgi:hypothetical protein
MSYGYGQVRSLSDTLKSLGLAVPVTSQERLTESVKKDEKSAKKNLIESARAAAAVKTDSRIAAKPSGAKKALTILEEIEAIEKSIKAETLVASKPEAEKLPEEMNNVLLGLSHIKRHSESIIKKFEWRNTSAAKIVTETFKAIVAEAVANTTKIKSGGISEASEAKTECDRLTKRFVEAVEHVKGDLNVNKEAFAKLSAHLKDVK